MNELNICSDDNMVFIYIGGVSSSDPDFTKEYKNGEKSYVFESVSYISSKRPDYVIDDILTGRIDARQLSQGIQPKPDTLRKAIRLNNLVSIISFYMRFTSRKIVVIGVSHGSLIVHAAILKIKALYRPIEHLFNIFTNRIIVLTLGSPKYLPIRLLKHVTNTGNIQFGNVYNFYNTKDAIYSLLNQIRKIGLNSLSYLKFPELISNRPDNNYTDIPQYLSINPEITSNIPKFKYDEEKHMIFVKNTEYLKYFKSNSVHDTGIIKELCDTTPSIIFYHSILFHFFPIFQENLHIIHYMRNIKSTDRSTDDSSGSLKEIDNRSVFASDLMDIQQGGRKNKKIRKVKKYLKKIN